MTRSVSVPAAEGEGAMDRLSDNSSVSLNARRSASQGQTNASSDSGQQKEWSRIARASSEHSWCWTSVLGSTSNMLISTTAVPATWLSDSLPACHLTVHHHVTWPSECLPTCHLTVHQNVTWPSDSLPACHLTVHQHVSWPSDCLPTCHLTVHQHVSWPSDCLPTCHLTVHQHVTWLSTNMSPGVVTVYQHDTWLSTNMSFDCSPACHLIVHQHVTSLSNSRVLMIVQMALLSIYYFIVYKQYDINNNILLDCQMVTTQKYKQTTWQRWQHGKFYQQTTRQRWPQRTSLEKVTTQITFF